MPATWRLARSCRDDAQGLIVSGYSRLPQGAALLLDATQATGAGWLRSLMGAGFSVTAASGPPQADQADAGSCAFALTASGLAQLGLDAAIVAGFAVPFQEGMHETLRRQRLHDDVLSLPGRNQPYWGSNGTPLPGTTVQRCEKTVHAALLLYEKTEASLSARITTLRATLAAVGVDVAHWLPIMLDTASGDPTCNRENFGFADGISQPLPYGAGIVGTDGTVYPRDPVHGVAAGDLLLGHIDSLGKPAPGPIVPDCLTAPKEARDLGLNGSYLVMRELSQDPESFWASMQAAAAAVGAASSDWIAERTVGRCKDGRPLSIDPAAAHNEFLYWATDREGRHCPLGAHIRRANPRDGLAPAAATTTTSLSAVNNHRILRRGRKYPPYRVPGTEKALPGLLFMCLNTDLERQFEFVQQNWLLTGSFAALFKEYDPLLGPGSALTIPTDGLRLQPRIETAIRFVGGEYFFLPSLPALRYFESLP